MATNNHITRKQAEKEIESTFGFVPEFYSTIPDKALPAYWSVQRDLELNQTVLDNKTKELIGLAVAAQIKCQYCTYFHSRAAQSFGASNEEIKEAIAMGGTVPLFSNSLNGMRYDIDKFKREVERAVEYVGKHQRK